MNIPTQRMRKRITAIGVKLAEMLCRFFEIRIIRGIWNYIIVGMRN